MRYCSLSTRGSPRTVRKSPNLSHCNIVVSSNRDFISSFTSAYEPLFVDAENLVSVCPATKMILDFAIVVFHIRLVHKLNFEMKTSNIDSAITPRGN